VTDSDAVTITMFWRHIDAHITR